MHTPESIETALARLMPPALSESGQRAIEDMLDELAATAPAAVRRRKLARRARYLVPAGIAAALAVGMGPALKQAPSALPLAVNHAPAAVETTAAPGLVLLSESAQVEDIADGGWLGSPDGETMQAVRCRMVEASRFLDEESGIEVEVSEPREEVVLTPVSVF